MLSIPKSTGDNTDYAHGIRHFISSQNFVADPAQVDYDVQTYITRRSSMLNSLGVEADKNAYLAFHRMSTRISPRLEGYHHTLNMQFKWNDAFDGNPTCSRVHNSFYFDWANCLWNLAAHESLQGSKTNRSTEDGIRNSCKLFQSAAGIFDFISSNLMKPMTATNLNLSVMDVEEGLEQSYTSNISMATLEFCKVLMLAQAQLCFYEKAVRDSKGGKMKAATVAKLALQVAKYYETAMQVSSRLEDS